MQARSLPRWLIAPVVVTVALLANALPVTGTVLENMSGAASYLAIHATKISEGAYLDHSATASIEYYLANDSVKLRAFPQSKHQRNLSGLDLSVNKEASRGASATIWLVDDRSTSGANRFFRALRSNGYVILQTRHFTGALPIWVEQWHRAAPQS